MPGRFPPLECQNNLNHQSLIKRLEVHDKTTSNKTVLPETPVTAVVYPLQPWKWNILTNWKGKSSSKSPFLGLNHVNLPGFPGTCSRYLYHLFHPPTCKVNGRMKEHVPLLVATACWNSILDRSYIDKFHEALPCLPPIKISISWTRNKAGLLIRAHWKMVSLKKVGY